MLGEGPPLVVAPLLAAIAAQAGEADRSRTVAPSVIAELKRSDLVRLAAKQAEAYQ